MGSITLRLSDVKSEPEGRPASCQYCGSSVLQGWGRERKPIRDPQLREVVVRRYKCGMCGRTFRHYPLGVGAGDQSRRLQQLAATIWVLGLSLRSISGVLGVFNLQLAHMTVWRDVQAGGRERRVANWPPQARVLGVDGLWLKVKGKKRGVVVAVDLGNGAPVALLEVEEADSQAMANWLRPLMQELGVEVLVTDDLSGYGAVAEELQVQHQVCRFHMRRWVGRALRQLSQEVAPEWQAAIVEVQRIVRDLPADGRQLLYELWEQLGQVVHAVRKRPRSALERLRLIVLRLHQEWEKYTLFQRQLDVPATNNGSERAIGRWRTRSRTARGFKSLTGVEAAFFLCA